MTIRRAPRPVADFTLILNSVLRDERLSYRARGVLASILSRPDNWEATAEQLASEGKEGRDAIRVAMGELESFGYIERHKVQDDGGHWSNQAVVFDTPRGTRKPPGPENPFPVPENPSPGPEKPAPGNPVLQEQLSKKIPTGSFAPAPVDNAQKLIAEWIDNCPGGRPPGRVVGQVAKEVSFLLDEGIPYEQVRRGLQQWQSKRLHPSTLASVVHEVRTANGSSQPAKERVICKVCQRPQMACLRMARATGDDHVWTPTTVVA